MKQKAKLADARQFWITLLIVSGTLIQGAYGIHISVSGGDGGGSSSVGMNIDALREATVNSQVTVSGANIMPAMRTIGPTALFEETHSARDSAGKSAKVYVKVVNAPNGLTYDSRVLPKEGSVGSQTFVSAEQWLTVPKADSIKCTATASYGTRSYDVGLEESKGLAVGDYVALNGYYGKAYSSGTSLFASQTAADGSANSVKIYGHSKDSDGDFSVDTTVNGISGAKASFTGLNSESSKGTTKVSQKEHILGSFTSTAKAGTKTITRTSNYGSEYDLNMQAKKGPSVSGIVGYYVNPATSANKIQGAVNAARSGDIINIAAGTYKEKVQIDKSLVVKGANKDKTFIDGNKASRVFLIGNGNPNIDVTLSGMTIRNGATSGYGGGIWNNGRTTVVDSTISGNTADYGGGVYNNGKLTLSDSTISGNTADFGGAITNDIDGQLTMNSGSIDYNSASFGGGIANWGTVTQAGGSISGNTASYSGGGIFNDAGTVTQSGGSIKGNSANFGGGVANDVGGKFTLNSGSIDHNTATTSGGGIGNWGTVNQIGGSISDNTADNGGGGIYNDGGIVTQSGGSISRNSATYGGGVYDDSAATVNLKSGSIDHNTASFGGGIFNGYGGTVSQTGGSISANTATNSGGGIFNEAGTITQDGGSISSNNAVYGGGITNDIGGKVYLNKGFIDHNIATSGGGIANWDTVNLNGATISYNKANSGGGGIINWGTVNLNSGSIDHNTATRGGGILNAGTVSGNKNLVHDNTPNGIATP